MSFRTRRRVEFRDTDAAGIVHFSAFFPWMESAEHELLRSIEIPILPHASDGVTWPRVSVSCDYREAARFEDLIDIDVSIVRIGTSSIQYGFHFSRMDESHSVALATGKTIVVCCRLRQGGGLEKTALPDEIRAKLAPLLA